MKRVNLMTVAWAMALASVFFLASGRTLRMSALFVTMLAFAAMRLRPWFAAFSIAVLASWVMGSKVDAFGWTQVLMVCAAMAAVDFAAGQRERILSALPYLWPVFAASWVWDKLHGFSGCATLDNIILAGPIFALLSVLVVERNLLAGAAYALLCVLMESTTGALVLLACYAPLALKYFRGQWVCIGGIAGIVGYVIAIDHVHVGYGQRWEVIEKTFAAAIAQPLGHGWGTYKVFALTNLPRTWAGEVYAHAHSDAVQLFYEAGIVCTLIAAAYFVRSLVKTYRAEQYAALGSLCGLAIFSAIGFPWHVAPSAATGLLVLANLEASVGGECVPA